MDNINTSFEKEVNQGERFEFGKNWKNFITHLDNEKIKEAEVSLINFVGDLRGKKFIDVGSGSGLFSLAAKNMGAKVHSFDYDPNSFYCTTQLKQKFYPVDPEWTVEQASVLDKKYLESLGKFDVVYSWGVLHHTGKMWEALNNVDSLVNSNGILFIAIYNNQGGLSSYWTGVKKLYNKGWLGKGLVSATHIPYFFLRAIGAGIIRHRNPMGYIRNYKKVRGMNVWFDWIDWLGGLPFETATPKQIEDFYSGKGYILIKKQTTSGIGCNEFVFKKQAV